MKIKSIKKKVIILIACVLVISASISSAQITDKNQSIENAKNAIQKITGNNFGELKYEKDDTLNNRKLYIISDDKYTYKYSVDDNIIATIVSKDCGRLINTDGTMSKNEILKIAEGLVDKYANHSPGCKYVLTYYTHHDTDNNKCHNLAYTEETKDGVETGWGIFMGISNTGEIIGLATHAGNADIALNTKASLSKSEAEDIAEKYIRELLKNAGISSMPNPVSKLTVGGDNLNWRVAYEGIKGQGAEYGYVLFIDANTGDILEKYNYCGAK